VSGMARTLAGGARGVKGFSAPGLYFRY
jgi:hypothetical protein